jgi:hypothetical protein
MINTTQSYYFKYISIVPTNKIFSLHDTEIRNVSLNDDKSLSNTEEILKLIRKFGLDIDDNRELFIPKSIRYNLTNLSYKRLEIFNLKGRLFPNLGVKADSLNEVPNSQRLLIDPSGLFDLISSNEGYTIFGTNSKMVRLAQDYEEIFLNDGIDYYLKIKSNISIQYFYIDYNKGKLFENIQLT